MTSYSTYGTHRIRLVDGTLTPEDDERRADELEQITRCIEAGACRALLDGCTDLADGDAVVNAEEWHSADLGWEQSAVTDTDLPHVTTVVEAFVRDNLDNILCLANEIAWGARNRSEIWSGDQGMAIYRVGYLLGMQLQGHGIGLNDYMHPCGERLYVWPKWRGFDHAFEGVYIDSKEEPCLLHVPPLVKPAPPVRYSYRGDV